MSLATNVVEFAIRTGTELKLLRTLINGNQPGLSGLSTQAKANLVDALNEIHAALATAAGIDDTQVTAESTWSSSKTRTEIDQASTDDRARTNHSGTQSATTVDESADRKWLSAAERSKLAGVSTGATANASDAQLRDRSTHTGTQPVESIAGFAAEVRALISEVVDGAPGALDTLNELAAAIGDDPDFAGTITRGLSVRLRFDAPQSLTAQEAAQARANIGAVSAADVGDTTTNFVTSLEAALV